jgi:ABC-type phosphate/phosphonate transport system ATPase subunit
MDASFRIGNYRCFPGTRPATIRLRDGDIALVGANNSGKSALMRFFYELRHVFGTLADDPNCYIHSAKGSAHSANLQAYTQHWENMFHISNNVNILITMTVDHDVYRAQPEAFQHQSDPAVTPKELRIELVRNSMGSFHVSLIDQGGDPIDLTNAQVTPTQQLGFSLQNRLCACAHFYDALRKVSEAMYVGPFRNAMTGGADTTFDIKSGSAVIVEWSMLKGGDNPISARKIQRVTELIKEIFGYTNLEIDANDTRTDFLVRIDGERYSLSQLGSGLAQFITVLVNVATKNPSFIFIDEPELHLHPALQTRFIAALRSFASCGVVFSTHNVGLARAAADDIYTLHRQGVYSDVRTWNKRSKLSALIAEIGFSAHQDLGFESILLVEGVTEIKAIREVLRKLRKDHKVLPIPLGGSSLINGSRDNELSEITRITKSMYALIDSERDSEGENLAKDRNEFKNSCQNADIKCHVTERRATENYLTESAIKKAISTKARALGPYERLDSKAAGWGKNDIWRIASEMSADEWRGTDIGKFLEQIEAKDV